MEDALELIGAGSLPYGPTQLNASVPLVRLTADAAGITVVLRSSLLSTFFSLGTNFRGRPRQLTWSARWGQISHVARSERTVVIFKAQGRGCRFSVRRGKKLEPLIEMFSAHEIPVEQVRFIARYVFRI